MATNPPEEGNPAIERARAVLRLPNQPGTHHRMRTLAVILELNKLGDQLQYNTSHLVAARPAALP